MDEEGTLAKMVHPDVAEEIRQRTSLRDALEAEEKLLDRAAELTGSEAQRDMFKALSFSLFRIRERWETGDEFSLDPEKKQFTRIRKGEDNGED